MKTDLNARLAGVLLAINEVSNRENLGFDRKLQAILEEITAGLGARSGSIMLRKGAKTLEVAASTNPDLLGVKQRMEDEAPSAWVARTGKPLYVDDISRSEQFRPRFDHYSKSAFLLVPVVSQGRVIGVIGLTEKLGEDLFSEEEQELLLKVAGQLIGALESKRLAESLKRKKKTLQERNKQLRRLERLKTDLFRMLIHDLKGPISELTANLDILSYTASEENKGFVETAKGSCDTLYNMVSNLLDIARLEEGKLELIHERIEPSDLLGEALARVHWSMQERGLKVEKRFPPDSSQEGFWGDRGILLRVLQNLLTNAVGYSPEGKAVVVGFDYPDPGVVRFFVEDEGPGIPHEHQEKIFDKYAQLEKKGDGRMYTTGLGLTFCKMAVEAHRGRIYVESDGRLGSRFVFDLPMERGGRVRK
ncbi:MAG: ATP-binding protein [Desulfobacteraceae bacterium]